MIISRKLFSKKKKEVTESKQGKKNRRSFVWSTAGLATFGSGMALTRKPVDEWAAGKMANDNTLRTIVNNADLNKLNKSARVAERKMEITDKIMNSKMNNSDRINSMANLKKVVGKINEKINKDYDAVVKPAKESHKKMENIINKKFRKSIGKRSLVAGGIGLATGIGMDQLIKHRQKKLGIKRRDD